MAIYLDHNAGAPLRPEVKAALEDFLGDGRAGNPASVHRAGQRARRSLEAARANVAALVGAQARQIVFTSGGTESNNAAIRGAAAFLPRRRLISSTVEHSSVLQPLKRMDAEEREVILVGCDLEGRVDIRGAIERLDGNTALVTLGLANSEVGTIQEFDELVSAVRRAGAIFHIDAAQALGRIPVSVRELGCDLLTMSGHKIGAPSGVGALFVRNPDRMVPLFAGGPQEGGLRAGTPNLLGAIGFGVAAEAVADSFEAEATHVARMTRQLLELLTNAIPGLKLNGSIERRLPNTLNLTFPGVLGETMLIALDLEGVEVSMGSACAAGAVEPSHVLLAMGRSESEARSSLRLSLGPSNTEADIVEAADIIHRVWSRVVAAEPARAEAMS